MDSMDKIVISALLVQQQSWEGVARTLEKLTLSKRATLSSLSELSGSEVEDLLRNLNFYKTKAKRLLNIATSIADSGGPRRMLRVENRDELLSLEGIGEETADCLLLFAGNQLVFPISSYVRTVLQRVLGRKLTTRDLRLLCLDSLPAELYSYKLLYAGLSTVGRAYCHKVPECANCILNGSCSFASDVKRGNSRPLATS